MKTTRTLALLAGIALLAGCGSSPPTSFYTLASHDGARSSLNKANYSVVVGPVSVPDLVDRPQMVLRSSGNQVKVEEFVRWAEPLKSEIPRIIAANLAQTLGDARVSVYPQTPELNPDFKIWIDVLRFDSIVGDSAIIEVLWTVRPAKGGEEKVGRSLISEATGGAGYDALVAAHARGLAAVSKEIAAAIRQQPATARSASQ